MSSPVFGDPPPGVDLTDNHTPSNNAAAISVFVLAVIAVALRFVARIKAQNAKISADDYMIVFALLWETVVFALTIEGGHYGLGKHVWVVETEDVIMMTKLMFVYVLVYAFTVPLIKLSIILFYRRVFGMNWALWICVFLTIGYWLACSIAFLAACDPPSYFWTQYLDPKGGRLRFDLYPFYIGNAAANVITDGIILIVPIPLVWKLQMQRTRKILITGIFMLGGFVCVASIVRIHFMTFLKDSIDVTWIMGDVFIWSSVEPCIGIVCACLPTLQPLFRRIFVSLRSSLSDNSPSKPQIFASGSVHSGKLMGRSDSRRFRHLSSQERSQFRPQDDEAVLTTHVELDTLERGSDGDNSSDHIGMGIIVKKEFQWKEQQLEE